MPSANLLTCYLCRREKFLISINKIEYYETLSFSSSTHCIFYYRIICTEVRRFGTNTAYGLEQLEQVCLQH